MTTTRRPLKEFWREYPSIDTTKDKGHPNKITLKDGEEEKWIALEKVHGSNFCFIVGHEFEDHQNGDERAKDSPHDIEIIGARRTAVLQPYETFFGWQEVRDRIKEQLKSLFLETKNELGIELRAIAVFGGAFPSPHLLPLFLPHLLLFPFQSSLVVSILTLQLKILANNSSKRESTILQTSPFTPLTWKPSQVTIFYKEPGQIGTHVQRQGYIHDLDILPSISPSSSPLLSLLSQLLAFLPLFNKALG
jgi:hypothetical protein